MCGRRPWRALLFFSLPSPLRRKKSLQTTLAPAVIAFTPQKNTPTARKYIPPPRPTNRLPKFPLSPTLQQFLHRGELKLQTFPQFQVAKNTHFSSILLTPLSAIDEA